MVHFKYGMGYVMHRLGIILAAGKSSRLYPSTLTVTKQLLPVYDKPLIYYPLSTLMLAGIRDFVIIVSPSDFNIFSRLFQDSETEMGINVTILVQESPLGIADTFKVIERNIPQRIFDYDQHVLILGDNIFYGAGLSTLLEQTNPAHANVFLYKVTDATSFGVAEVKNNLVVSVEEKPTKPKSDLAITGLYFYPPSVYLYTNVLNPSKRGELEITDLNDFYLKRNELTGVQMHRGMVWFDTGEADTMLEASNFIQNVQKHQGYIVGSPHEIAFNKGWITKEQLKPFANKCQNSAYGKYLLHLIDG